MAFLSFTNPNWYIGSGGDHGESEYGKVLGIHRSCPSNRVKKKQSLYAHNQMVIGLGRRLMGAAEEDIANKRGARCMQAIIWERGDGAAKACSDYE
jgi:hypothetical protein